ncbi:MAG: double-strand break repair protein AddB [Rhodobacteraceae bacterium]|nr:double-strand break repair protein AddB [Paracoccaceae bacterium]MCF8516038.1 double-strand break repair protein AddB [Paracoccaceae bacterium]MCF8520377.1 double-strand break repair protein AddB [Paracoccaceae bacterium]
MFKGEGPHIFGLPPGVDFPEALVAGLRDRMAGQPTESMARITLYLNTARMRRRVTEIFTQSGSSFLPRLRLVTDLGAESLALGVPPAIPTLRRKLQLSVLVARLLDNAKDMAPRSSIADLSESLAALMSEMQGEGVDPDRLASLDVSDFSEHWARTRAFLTIIAPFFTDAEQPDAEGRQRRLAMHLRDQWAVAPPDGPIIIAGSTGSRGTTALLMQAVAALPQGAIVLPGFDFDMPAAIWDRLDDALTSEDHPQYRFRKIMDMLGIGRAEVAAWHATQPTSIPRNQVVSLALRPAPVTDQWMVEGQFLPELCDATKDLTLIEAATPRQEALSIALILREAAEVGKRAALISPDRTLTRRVSAALDRWGIRADDSAGIPLNQSAPGRFLRHIARLFGRRLTSDGLLTLLKHPLTASAMERGEHLRLTRELELTLRDKGPAFPEGVDIVAWAAAQKNPLALGWATALAGAIDALSDTEMLPLADHVARTLAMAERLARGPAPEGTGELWLEAPGEKALSFMRTLAQEADHGGELTPAEFRDLFDGLISAEEVRDSRIAHPGIMIWGTIEARVQGADLVILGGLNDGTWPKLPPPDPWLNRKMRKDAGLLLPERRIGLAAHDFQQAIGAPEVILTRAKRDAEAETVPSRWINRLTCLLDGLPSKNGPEALAQMRSRGLMWLDRAALLDRPLTDVDPDLLPAGRPAPRPPVSARPDRLSLTRIERLIRDPYAIYADKILNLHPLRPLRQVPDARDRGTVVHAILERFVKERPADETMEQALARLSVITTVELAEQVPWPAARALWSARMGRAAAHFLAVDTKDGGVAEKLEERGELPLTDLGFTLFGTPDRIDRLPDGTLHLIDYKTGSPPTAEQQKSFAKQLLLAALMAEEGGFRALGPQTVNKISYIGLGAQGKVTETVMDDEQREGVRKGLRRLIESYMSQSQGYTSRRAVFSEQFPGDYDHLARFGEWEMTDSPAPTLVGAQDGT